MNAQPLATVLLISAAFAQPLLGQNPDPSSSSATAAKGWEFSVVAETYFVPDETNYVSPTLRADRDWLHLQARYNNEDLRTGSIWIGYNFRAGSNLAFEITPMFGAVVGRTQGVGPGALISLTYRKFDFYNESEYVFNADDRTDSFFYAWSELGYSPVDWLRVGFAGQRTRTYKTPLDLQRGPFAGVSYKSMTFTTYVFNLGWTDPTVVLAAAFDF